MGEKINELFFLPTRTQKHNAPERRAGRNTEKLFNAKTLRIIEKNTPTLIMSRPVCSPNKTGIV